MLLKDLVRPSRRGKYCSMKEEAEDIAVAADNLIELVNGILDISKIEANKLK